MTGMVVEGTAVLLLCVGTDPASRSQVEATLQRAALECSPESPESNKGDY